MKRIRASVVVVVLAFAFGCGVTPKAGPPIVDAGADGGGGSGGAGGAGGSGCSPGLTMCGEECVSPGGSVDVDGGTRNDCDRVAADGCESDPATDPRNCGKCGIACPSLPHLTVACVSGECLAGDCVAGWYDCNNNSYDGCESSIACD